MQRNNLASTCRAPVAVTLLDGTPAEWNAALDISDRQGELTTDYRWDIKPEGHVLLKDAALLAQLRGQIIEGCGYIAAKDAKLGVLIEMEYFSIESDDEDPPCGYELKPYADVTAAIRDTHRSLQVKYPQVQFCVPHQGQVAFNRPAVWAFFENGALTAAERKSLCDEMLRLSTL